ncbi:hypothetical protein GLOIN_2v1775654 [Rhizophagus irregularis DAOM 181602=DAOM 197198]|uniref:Uncharacterized protein n=1 Tax=Rhizophagus irregularis (strain DAOM 181602 / DAOM 197198 / MUCL 43194) TaxID=747089 RepID=A0A2P4PZ35_RHIID|nr:hypothetical protein GLOIN_2v1775654 [Rhizophagus irregularis DAOM 181602=DAOM 197198]POG70651.1 hypothetical protein GLOIN_2v1775654 [Rhizophagus irregularis DAOM 181602=DAOM 197198]|eukprot:XP_025177517.1 hypothetical protein GLOIN_2v1775654 [Rhizophagus irregularis DAOM 181602=DAOM 197198]
MDSVNNFKEKYQIDPLYTTPTDIGVAEDTTLTDIGVAEDTTLTDIGVAEDTTPTDIGVVEDKKNFFITEFSNNLIAPAWCSLSFLFIE